MVQRHEAVNTRLQQGPAEGQGMRTKSSSGVNEKKKKYI